MVLKVTVTDGVRTATPVSTMPSFTLKQLRVTFTLGSGRTFANGTNRLQLSGLRTIANVRSAGFPTFPEADVQIYGMAQSDMNSLIALQANLEGVTRTDGVSRNTITLEANTGSGWTTFFLGDLGSAGPDYSAMPDVCLRVLARALLYASTAPAEPASYTGPTDVATIISQLAKKMGYAFENHGVTTQLSNPYFPGTLGDQLKAVWQHAGIDCYTDDGAKVIAIMPKGMPRNLAVWTLSPSTGLVGYPSRDDAGYVLARSLFNPAFHFGGLVNIAESGLPNIPGQPGYNVDGTWLIGSISHMIEAVKPDGLWFSDLHCYVPGTAGAATPPPS